MYIHLRTYQPEDCPILTALFYNTVHRINRRDYSHQQVHAWADGNPDFSRWNTSFLSHYTLIAEIDGTIVGFGDIDQTGYLDHLFVHHNCQNLGIGTALCDRLEHWAPTSKIITHASITAREFFEQRGYRVIRKQLVQRHRIFLPNYVMAYSPAWQSHLQADSRPDHKNGSLSAPGCTSSGD